MKLTLSTFLIVLLVFSAPCLSQSAGFIRISASAPVDKPYPTIIFYSVEMLDTTFENPFVHRFEVNNSLLVKLKEVILGTELPSDDEMIDPSIIFRMSIGVTDTIRNVGFRTSAYKIFNENDICIYFGKQTKLINSHKPDGFEIKDTHYQSGLKVLTAHNI